MIRHRKSNTRLYNIYSHMKSRCYDSNNDHYKWYAARGITICDEWLNDFMSFYEWAMNNGYKENLTLDRIDNDKGYSPDNCRWTTMKVQVRNRSNTRNITYKGETKTLTEWCDQLELNYKTIYARLYVHDWPVGKALNLE